MIDIVSDELRKEIQKIELNMLLVVDSICKKLEIDYFMVGGTLLGAVRHKGFIPWDDDVDIGMLRGDYEIFVNEAKKLLPSDLFLQTMYTDEDMPFNFAKIRNSRTTFIETSTKNLNINHGVYIDVFPFDYYPDNKVISVVNKTLLTFATQRVNMAFYTNIKPRFTLAGKIVNTISNTVFKDVRHALIAREKIYKATSKSTLVTNYCGAWGDREIVPAEWVAEYIVLEFEGYYFKAPREYDKYLKNIYGDYMRLPPEEKRIGHHYTERIDTKRSYTFYL